SFVAGSGRANHERPSVVRRRGGAPRGGRTQTSPRSVSPAVTTRVRPSGRKRGNAGGKGTSGTRRRASPAGRPSFIGIAQASSRPPRREVNRSVAPSGDQEGR